MPAPQFSEFSYGFAYTREVVQKCWTAVRGAPVLPSLYDEGRGGGFDVSVGLRGWTYFAQFKRSDFLSRSNARWWHDHGGSYYRFPITRPRHSRQHELLLELERESVFHIVEYVAPRFHTNAELSIHFLRGTVMAKSLRVFPASVGNFVDAQQHYVTFTRAGAPVVRSDPLYVEPPYNAGALNDWRPAIEALEPVELNEETFDAISEKLIAIATQVGVPTRRFAEALVDLSAFARARNLGRVLVGAELIPLVVGNGEE